MAISRLRILNALEKHFEAHIEKHIVNVENYIDRGVGVAEHPDLMESIESELAQIAEYDDKLEMLKKHFKL